MTRSGANLLGNILDSHPTIACGPETGIIDEIAAVYLSMLDGHRSGRLSPYVSEQEIRQAVASSIRAIYAPYAKKKGKTIVVDRTPNNVWSFPIIAELLPEAKFINLIRDGRDVACSQRDVGARLQASGVDIKTLADATLRSPFYCAAVWAETVRFAWEQSGPASTLAGQGRAFTTFYENIVLSPESQIRNICDFIGVPFSSEMLYPERHQHDVVADNIWTMKESLESPISMLSAGRWIDHLSLTDRIMFYARGHVGLRITGYDESPEWLFRGTSMSVEQATQALDKARAEFTGIADASAAPQQRESGISPARVTVEKIIASSNIGGGALGNPVPEVEALLRTAKQAGRTFIGG
jgi:hypothetical protein